MIWEVYTVRNKKPPFEITEAALSEVMEISELVGKISSTQNLSTSPILRRQNRIRTIYSSLAIEQNTLSLEQVTAVLSGKRVLAPPKDIAEVKNAYEIYDHLAELNRRKFSSLSQPFRYTSVIRKSAAYPHYNSMPFQFFRKWTFMFAV